MTSNIVGKFRFLPLKGGGMTLTVDVPVDADIDVMMPECARMFNKDVVISLHQPQLDTPPPAGTVERDALVSARDKVADALAILSEQLGVGEPAGEFRCENCLGVFGGPSYAEDVDLCKSCHSDIEPTESTTTGAPGADYMLDNESGETDESGASEPWPYAPPLDDPDVIRQCEDLLISVDSVPDEPPQSTSATEGDEPEQDAPPALVQCGWPIDDEPCQTCEHAQRHTRESCYETMHPLGCPAGDEQACREVV